MRLVLDSAFIIDVLNGLPEAIARYGRIYEFADEPFVTEVIVCEVRTGLDDSDAGKLEGLLRPVEFVQPGPAHAMLAGRWRVEARRQGRHLSLADALIAAAAEAAGAAVLTRNVRDFALTPIRVETY